jgi:peptide/nickel transport system substrate-binding protein
MVRRWRQPTGKMRHCNERVTSLEGNGRRNMKRGLSYVLASLAYPAAVLASVPALAAEPTGSIVSVTSDLAGMGMDPLLDNTGSPKVFTDEVHLNAVMQDPDGKLIPGAALKWEPSADRKSWIWTLREGVKFHDGSPVTAQDFAWSWKRAVMSPESQNPYKAAYGPLIEDIYAEGNTVVVRTKTPQALMPLWWPTYDNQVGYVLSKAQFDREGNEGLRNKPIGAGSFRLKERNLPGRFVELEAVSDHYCCVASVKNVRIMEVPELSTRLALLRTGRADIIEATPAARKEIEASGNRVMTGLAGAVSVMWYPYQHYSKNPFNDIRVREALSIAIDRKAIVNRIYAGAGGPLSSFFSGPGTIGYVRDLPPDPLNPARAKQLLKEAGYPNGFPVRILTYSFDGDFPDLPTLSQAVLGFLQELGITGEVQVMEWDALKNQINKMLTDACGDAKKVVCTEQEAKNAEIASKPPFTLIIRGDKSRYHSLRQNRQYQSTIANANPVIQVAEVDAAIRAMETEFDIEKQTKLFEDFNRLMRKGFYNAPLVYADTVFGVSNRIAAWQPIAGRPFPNNHWTIKLKQ